jgi:hypothetical protein
MVIVPYGFIEMASAVVRHEENPVVARREIVLTLLAGIDGRSNDLLNNAMYLNGPGRRSLLSNILPISGGREIAGSEAKIRGRGVHRRLIRQGSAIQQGRSTFARR